MSNLSDGCLMDLIKKMSALIEGSNKSRLEIIVTFVAHTMF